MLSPEAGVRHPAVAQRATSRSIEIGLQRGEVPDVVGWCWRYVLADHDPRQLEDMLVYVMVTNTGGRSVKTC
jgi:hypothetical protein